MQGPVPHPSLPSSASYKISGPPSSFGSIEIDPSQVLVVTGWMGGGRRCQWMRSLLMMWSQWLWQH